MFNVIQIRDFTGAPLSERVIRTVYAADYPSGMFLTTASMANEFIWIPIISCIPLRGGYLI